MKTSVRFVFALLIALPVMLVATPIMLLTDYAFDYDNAPKLNDWKNLFDCLVFKE